MPSTEARLMSFYLLILSLLAIIGYAVSYAYHNPSMLISISTRYVEDYQAVLELDDMMLTETISYAIRPRPLHSSETHMLYRNWDSPLVMPNDTIDVPHVELVEIKCPPKAIGYLIDHTGDAYILSAKNGDNVFTPPGRKILKDELARLAHIRVSQISGVENEAGCLFVEPVDRGVYTVTYKFRLYPPITSNGTYSYTSIHLAGGDHLPYMHYTLKLEPATYIVDAHTTPPTTWKPGYTAEFEGLLYGLRLDVLVSDTLAGHVEHGDPLNLYRESVGRLNTLYTLLNAYSIMIPATLAAIPVIVAILWYLGGRDISDYTPRLTAEPPGELKPWQAAALTRPSLTPGSRGFIATALDLLHRGILEYDPVTGTLRKKPGSPSAGQLDFYEMGVINFLETVQEEGLHKKRFSRLRPMPSSIRRIARELEERARKQMEEIAEKSRLSKTLTMLSAVIAASSIAAGLVSYYIGGSVLTDVVAPTVIGGLLILGDIAVLHISPPWLLGRLKKPYRETLAKLESYKRFLINTSSAMQGGREAVPAATRHLAYAVALGLNRRQIERLAETLGLSSYIGAYTLLHTRIGRYYARSSGGSGGGAGGFGGGGAGAR